MVVTSFIFALMASASLAVDDDLSTEPRTRKTHLPPIRTLTIRKNGATSAASGDSAKQCADFKLSNQEIRAYFGKAAEVAEHDYFHMLDWSPCYASGQVVFKNRITGIWTIHQYRGGSLTLNNGRILFLYCPLCQARAFPSADK
jgi:hypothetical protein